MGRKWQLIAALVLVLAVTSGLYAFTYISATATMDVTVAGTEIASVQDAASQPDWDSVLDYEGTETFRPNAPGDETNISDEYPVSGEHWGLVDEETADGDSTYVSTEWWEWQEDLYNIPDHFVGSGTISYVKVYMVCKAERDPNQTSAYVHIKTNGVEYNRSENTLTTSYATYSYQWDTNPQTGNDWTWDEIDALQIGVGLRRPRTNTWTRCTQVYAEVGYSTMLLYSDVPAGDLFEIAPDTDYTGDFAVKVCLTNTGALVKAYSYLNMKLYLEGSVEAGETPDYLLLTLEDGGVTFNMKNYAPGTYTLSVVGGSYCLVSTDTTEWEAGWTVTPEFYCKILQRTE